MSLVFSVVNFLKFKAKNLQALQQAEKKNFLTHNYKSNNNTIVLAQPQNESMYILTNYITKQL